METPQHRVGDLVGRRRFHRLGHAVGIARRLEETAADAAHHQMVDAACVAQRRGERDLRAHRKAYDVRTLDAGCVHQREDVARHRLAVVPRRFVRLGALAMAAMVEREAAQTFCSDGVVPAHAFPVLVLVGRKTVQQNDRLAGVLRSERVIGKV